MSERTHTSELVVERILPEVRRGHMVILVDDEDRENEGDLFVAAERATPEAINFMARHGRGLICLSITEEKAQALQLPPMVHDNSSAFGTAFTAHDDRRARHHATEFVLHDAGNRGLAGFGGQCDEAQEEHKGCTHDGQY